MKNYIKIDKTKIELTDEQVKKIVKQNQIGEPEMEEINQMKKLADEFFKKAEEFIEKQKNIELEDHNFKVNSDGWVKKTSEDAEYLENPEGDIIEFINCEYPELNGEQLFTWDAAMRETKKAGKRMPTDEEFDIIFEDNDNIVIENLKYCGFRSTDGSSFGNLNVYAHWWSSSQSSSTDSWSRCLSRVYSVVHRNTSYKLYGFSVRCIK